MQTVIHYFSQTGTGGIESWLLRYLTLETVNQKIKIPTLLIRKTGNLHDDFLKLKIPITVIGRFRNVISGIPVIIKTAKQQSNKKNKLLHIHEYGLYGLLLALLVKYLYGFKIVTHIHNTPDQNKAVYISEMIAVNILRVISSNFIFCGVLTKQKWEKITLGRMNSITVRYGLPERSRGNWKRNSHPNFESKKKKVFILARYSKQKNPDFVLDIARALADSDISIEWFGRGEEEQYLKKQIEERCLTEKLKLMGPINNPWDNLRLEEYGCMLLPSKFEGFPVVITEAICNGIDTIISSEITNEFSSIETVSYLGIKNEDIQSWKKSIMNKCSKVKSTKLDWDKIKDLRINIEDNSNDINCLYSTMYK